MAVSVDMIRLKIGRESNLFRLYALASAAIALGVYLATLAPDLTWANAAFDGGELITASATLGIAHPPGYPLYIVLGKAFSLLPLGTVAHRYNLFSAVCMAVAVGLLVLAIGSPHRTAVRPPIASAAALLFAFTPLVWGQAVVAEVYALNLLALAAFLLAWSRRASAVWVGIWLGLAITTHLTSLLMLPLALTGHGRRMKILMGIAIGLSPLLLLPRLADGASPVVWGDASDPASWWWLVSARLYAANLHFPPDAGRLLDSLPALVLGPLGLILAGGAARIGSKRAKAYFLAENKRVEMAALAGATMLYGGFALIYDTPDAAITLIPGLMLLALLFAAGLERLGPAALLLPALLVVTAFPGQDISRDRQVRPLVEKLLHEAPANAILLTPGDRTIFTLWYFQHVEDQRPDLRLVDANLFAFDWYRARLSRQFPDVTVPEDDDLAAFQRLNEVGRPFCLAGLVENPGEHPLDGFVSNNSDEAPPYLNCTEDNN
jgi:hypothetical protein